MAINNQVVNTNGRGSNAYSNTFHGLRRTVDGKLYYTLRDKNVGTFSNDGGTTQLLNDGDYVAVIEEFISGVDETFAGDGTDTTFTLSTTGHFVDRLAVFVDRTRLTAGTDYTLSGTTLTFTLAPHNGANIFVRKIKKELFNTATTYQQYKFESGRNHYKLNSDGMFVKKENRKMPIDEANFPDDVLDSEYSNYNGNAIVNTTTWSV